MPRIPLPERRARLIAAAVRVIGDRGVNAATTRAIAAEADMPLASFHYAFESHNTLMGEVMNHVLEFDASRLREVVHNAQTMPKAVEAALQGHLDSLVEDMRRQRSIQELTHYALRTKGLEHIAVEQQAKARRTVAGMLETYAREHGVSYTVSAELLADQLLVLTDGISMAYVIDRDAAAIRAYIPQLARSFEGYVKD